MPRDENQLLRIAGPKVGIHFPTVGQSMQRRTRLHHDSSLQPSAFKVPNTMSEEQQDPQALVKTNKPRARLGPIETVYLPASDSEPEDDGDENESKADGEAPEDPDFLKDYPDDTEVSGARRDLVQALIHERNLLTLLKELQLLHLRLKSSSLPPLNFPRFGRNLKRLCLRQNDITSPIPAEILEGLYELEELDFYDNRIGPSVSDDEIKGSPNLT